MDLLINVVVAGLATSYVVETIADLSETRISSRITRHVLTLPLSYIACWYLDVLGFELVVSGLAAGFFSLATSRIVNRAASMPQVINNNRRY